MKRSFHVALYLLCMNELGGLLQTKGNTFSEDPPLPDIRPLTPDDCRLPAISRQEIRDAFAYAQEQASIRLKNENDFLKLDYEVNMYDISVEGRLLGTSANKSKMQNFVQFQFEDASKYLAKLKGLSKDQIRCLQKLSLPANQPVVKECKALQMTDPCDASAKYRSVDGSCNNLKNPNWGRVYSCFNRMIKEHYGDGISSPRLSTHNQNLPGPRFLSTSMDNDRNWTSDTYTHMVVGFGQFVAHDLAKSTSVTAGDDGSWYRCCPRNASVQFPTSCYPIDVPEDDYFYSRFKMNCLSFVRSASCSSDCKLGSPRRHVTQQTGFLDLSTIYGVSDMEIEDLKDKDNGKTGQLRHQSTKFGNMLPVSYNPETDQCTSAMPEDCSCFHSGDGRVNMQPGLTSMHLIWTRHHNQLAEMLANTSPNKTEEFIFQETRRIAIAMMQSIAYQELLPLVIGERLMNFFNLTVLDSGYTTYDRTANPTATSDFNSGPFRFGHSLVQNYFEKLSAGGKSEGVAHLRFNMFHPLDICEGRLDSILRGLYHEGAQRFDRHFVHAVSNHVMQAPGTDFGFDLVAINIQRGRDHGLPTYVEYLEFCYDIQIKKFADLQVVMSDSNWKRLEKLYKDVRDVDIYPGGFSETNLPDSILGPTFACIVGIEFHNTKFGDRFFFEHGNQIGSFTEGWEGVIHNYVPSCTLAYSYWEGGQLKELRKASLAKIICESSDNITEITPNVFRPISSRNRVTKCENIEEPDWSNWFNK